MLLDLLSLTYVFLEPNFKTLAEFVSWSQGSGNDIGSGRGWEGDADLNGADCFAEESQCRHLSDLEAYAVGH